MGLGLQGSGLEVEDRGVEGCRVRVIVEDFFEGDG